MYLPQCQAEQNVTSREEVIRVGFKVAIFIEVRAAVYAANAVQLY